jgi:hypothetical protein
VGVGVGGGGGVWHITHQPTTNHTKHEHAPPPKSEPTQNALAGSLWAAVLVVVVRLAAIAIGSWAGCRAGGVRQEHRKVFWMSQITQVGGLLVGRLVGWLADFALSVRRAQPTKPTHPTPKPISNRPPTEPQPTSPKAGVALGLTRIAGTAFPEWGGAFQALMTGVICVNMALGPPCFRAALIQVGFECGGIWRVWGAVRSSAFPCDKADLQHVYVMPHTQIKVGEARALALPLKAVTSGSHSDAGDAPAGGGGGGGGGAASTTPQRHRSKAEGAPAGGGGGGDGGGG